MDACKDRQYICNQIAKLLKLTNDGKNLSEIRHYYESGSEYADIIYDIHGHPYILTVNITGDSDICMIYDIIRKAFLQL